MERLITLKQYVQKQLPNTRERHALLEVIGVLELLVLKEPATQEDDEKPKRGRKPKD